MDVDGEEVRVPQPKRLRPGYVVVESVGPQLAGATGNVREARLRSALKVNIADRPYAVANEYIAARVGFAAGLPIPPGEIVRYTSAGGSQELAYVSLLFQPTGMSLPPVLPHKLAEVDPRFCMGVVLFDMWIRNGIDRHEENLGWLEDTGGVLFDHDMALLGSRHGKGAQDLGNAIDQPCLDGHCLPGEMRTVEHSWEWAARFSAVPAAVIKDSAETVRRLGLISVAERDAVIEFLVFRQKKLLTYLERCKSLFEKVSAWPLPGTDATGGE